MSSSQEIFLDANATTAVSPAVVDAMQPFLADVYGNPSSLHTPGQQARKAVDVARREVAALIGASPSEIIFTSCGSESNNMALKGVLEARPEIRTVITSAVEHSSVKATCEFLGRQGVNGLIVSVDGEGRLDLETLRVYLADTSDNCLVSLMWANNETGVIFPIRDIAEMTSARGAILHVDAVQAAGKVPIDVNLSGVDLLSLSGHKIYAPKGVGALFIRRGITCAPLLHGGSQENGLRSGTHNVAGIVGLGRACALAMKNLGIYQKEIAACRDRLEEALCATLPRVVINGKDTHRLPNTSSLCIPGIEGDALLLRLNDRGIYASAGSACAAGVMAPSHVLLAMGRTAAQARSAIRFSLAQNTSPAEIDIAANTILATIEAMR